MTDEEAERAAWGERFSDEHFLPQEWLCRDGLRHAFGLGFRAGLAHARKEAEQFNERVRRATNASNALSDNPYRIEHTERIAALERVAEAARACARWALEEDTEPIEPLADELAGALRALDSIKAQEWNHVE